MSCPLPGKDSEYAGLTARGPARVTVVRADSYTVTFRWEKDGVENYGACTPEQFERDFKLVPREPRPPTALPPDTAERTYVSAPETSDPAPSAP